MDTGIFFPETVEKQLFVTAGCIECALNRLHIGIVVLHVVGEHHQLCYIYEPAEYLSGEPGIDSVMLCNNAILVVRFLDLYEGQWHTVDQQNNVGTKFIIPISVSQFRYHMETVFAMIFEIYQAIPIDAIKQDIVKSTSQIIIGQFNGQFCQQCINIMIRQLFAVNSLDAGTEQATEDVGVFMDIAIIFLQR